MSVKENIKQNLAYFRKQRNLTTERVADVLGLSRQAYSNYENGTRDISVVYLKQLADFYGVGLDLMISSSIFDAHNNKVKFSTVVNNSGNLEFDNNPTSISNINASFIVLKISDLKAKIFETTIENVNNNEMLLEYKHKLILGKVFYHDDGSGIIVTNDAPIYFTKSEAKSIVFIGTLLAIVDKSYINDNFL